MRSVITGTGSYLPRRIVPNAELSTFLDTSDEWIRDRTGIGSRRIAADDEVTSDLATHAAARAIERAGIDKSSIELLVVATFTPDSPLPSCAVRVQTKLGLGTIPAFDVSAACAGFVYGLSIADQYIRAGTIECALVVGVELLSRVVDWNDRTTAILFGDGAGAAVLSRGSERGIVATRLHSDGSLADALMIPGGGSAEPFSTGEPITPRNKMHMLGQEVFRAAVQRQVEVVREIVIGAGLEMKDVDAFIPHQANLRIIAAVANRLGVSLDKFVLTLEGYGNTSSASIPITLDEALRSGRLLPGQRVVVFALGAGIAWGGSLIEL